MFLHCALLSPSLLTPPEGVRALDLRLCRFSRARCGSLSFTSTEPADSGAAARQQSATISQERWFTMKPPSWIAGRLAEAAAGPRGGPDGGALGGGRSPGWLGLPALPGASLGMIRPDFPFLSGAL